ncbi:MAG: hypothetical protein M1830_002770 [Pleopsidium flavum]|nr:MAG: hypothetical protein M1830_002770 [Pleopsidium flavum]
MISDQLVEDDNGESVNGSHFAVEPLPGSMIPEGKMPKEIAYRMIEDHLSLDGNPTLNLASFVSTYMEEEAEKLMIEALAKNSFDNEAYPQTADIQKRCVNMIAKLYHAPSDEGSDATGTSTVGSSEAIILSTLAMKRRWINKRKAQGKDYSRPNMIMNAAVQVCWKKAMRSFDIEEKYVYCTADRYVIDPKEAVDLANENTIAKFFYSGTTYTGHYEDTKAINDMLAARNIDVPIHVDAASGGFVAPFIVPGLEWDFRLEKVMSINVSGHKYGLVYPGVGWAVWRGPEYLPQELVFDINHPEQANFTLNSSRGASQILGQYYQFIRLGKSGYRAVMNNITKIADYLSSALKTLGFIILSENNGKGLPLVAFRFDPKHKHNFDEFALAHELRTRGWIVPAYTMAANATKLKLVRIVCRNDFSRSRCDSLIADVKAAVERLEKMERVTIQACARCEALGLALRISNEETRDGVGGSEMLSPDRLV